MRILVTGGAGFIGSHVAELAIERGHDVAVLDDLSSGKRANVPADSKFYQVDIRDAAATRQAFEEFKPEAVSHQAAQASVSVSMAQPKLDAEINVIGGLNVAEAAIEVGVEHLVFASTGGAIYGNIAQGAATESSPTDPQSPYAIHKFTYERLLAVLQGSGKLRSTVLRYANVYGPRQDPHGEAGVIAIFLNRMKVNQDIAVNGMRAEGDDGCIRDYVYVSDVAEANLRALEGRLDASLLNIGTSIPTTTAQLAKFLLELSPGSGTKIGSNVPRAGDVERSVLDGSLFREKIGDFVQLKEGLGETARWFHSA